MGSYEINELPELDKDKLIEILTDELSLILFYGYNEKTTDYVENIGAFTPSLKRILNVNRRTREDQ